MRLLIFHFSQSSEDTVHLGGFWHEQLFKPAALTWADCKAVPERHVGGNHKGYIEETFFTMVTFSLPNIIKAKDDIMMDYDQTPTA